MAIDAGQDGEIGAAFQKLVAYEAGVAHRHRELDLGMARQEAREHPHGDMRAVGRQAEPPALQLGRFDEDLAHLLLEAGVAPRHPEQALSHLGELDRAARPVEQLDAVGLLQRLHLDGERRLGEPERLGGPGEAAFACDRIEGTDLGVEHGPYY